MIIMGLRRKLLIGAMLSALGVILFESEASGAFLTARQKALQEWLSISSPPAPPPSVYVRDNHIRFFFETQTNVIAFSAHWSRSRVPTHGYRVHAARLHLDRDVSRAPQDEHGWHFATVIAGEEWLRFSSNLIAALTPETAGHGFYYQGLLADRLLYRDIDGNTHSTAIGQQPANIIVERHFSMQETLEILARLLDQHLAGTYPDASMFLLMAPDGRRFPQPLLLDREQHECVWLSPSALYDPTERGFSLAVTARGISSFVFESHGLALIKNPVSSAARLCDLVAQTLITILRSPVIGPRAQPASLRHLEGMDLVAWEKWLDLHTGTRSQQGSIKFLFDGEQFFPRLSHAIATATNHIRIEVFIFDKDDVSVEVADELRERSAQVRTEVIMDQMGSLAAGTVLPSTPLPEHFVEPSSIACYLRSNSNVHVRPFLNPWFSTDHSKVYLVDGTLAWLGGMNIGREYRYEWHDMMVELEGPVVASLENEFRREWAHEGPLGDLAYLGALLTQRKAAEASLCSAEQTSLRLLPTKTGWKPFCTAINGAIKNAQSYIYGENPYLFDKRVIVGLVRARNRGVDVRVVLPRVNDLKAVERSNLVLANYLLAHGVRVFFYPGMTHVKALLVDGWACAGSGNLNQPSLRLCQEHNVATSDPVVSGQLKHDLFENDFRHSVELTQPIAVGLGDVLTDLVLESF